MYSALRYFLYVKLNQKYFHKKRTIILICCSFWYIVKIPLGSLYISSVKDSWRLNINWYKYMNDIWTAPCLIISFIGMLQPIFLLFVPQQYLTQNIFYNNLHLLFAFSFNCSTNLFIKYDILCHFPWSYQYWLTFHQGDIAYTSDKMAIVQNPYWFRPGRGGGRNPGILAIKNEY